MFAFFLVEYARGGLLLVTPGLAAADFSGLVTVCLGRGGIDGGSSCFGDFGGGDPGGPIGSGGFGTHGAMVAAMCLRYAWVRLVVPTPPRPVLFLCEVRQRASSWSLV